MIPIYNSTNELSNGTVGLGIHNLVITPETMTPVFTNYLHRAMPTIVPNNLKKEDFVVKNGILRDEFSKFMNESMLRIRFNDDALMQLWSKSGDDKKNVLTRINKYKNYLNSGVLDPDASYDLYTKMLKFNAKQYESHAKHFMRYVQQSIIRETNFEAKHVLPVNKVFSAFDEAANSQPVPSMNPTPYIFALPVNQKSINSLDEILKPWGVQSFNIYGKSLNVSTPITVRQALETYKYDVLFGYFTKTA